MLVLFLWYYGRWASSASEKIEVDLLARLPRAKFRTTAFFIVVLTVCWLANFGVWAFLVIFLVFGLIGTFIIGNTGAPDLMFVGTAVALREWSFGFPSLILDIPNRDPKPFSDTNDHELIGVSGITSGPLRPSGYAHINDTEMAVIADCGTLIDADVEVTVTGFRNGTLRVRPVVTTNARSDGE